MVLRPDIEVNEDPGFHQPHTIFITFLDGFDHALTARAEVFRLHRLGLFVKSNGKPNIHFHEQITIVEMRSVTVEVGAVKKQTRLQRKDIVVPE